MTTDMTTRMNRREALLMLMSGAIAAFSLQYPRQGFAQGDSNFRHVYLDPKLRAQFFLFLKNVFHLYPEEEFHTLIFDNVVKLNSDKEIYQAILKGIPELKPFLGQVRYALPSLKQQKEIMCQQTINLLDGQKKFTRYLEIGTTGRYYDRLSKKLKFKEEPIFINDIEPSYSPSDIVERGKILKSGDFVPLYDYNEVRTDQVADESIDLMSVYIGFHHSPPEKRDRFIESCKRVLKKGGVLILRDHDVDSDDMTHFVALAHDVFNAGLELPWEKNEKEVRNFTSLKQLEELLSVQGFTVDQRKLLQEGDPTKNNLMRLTKK